MPKPIKPTVHPWGSGPQWIVDLDGALSPSDQPRTERELELSGHWCGPFRSEAAAEKWAEADYLSRLEGGGE